MVELYLSIIIFAITNFFVGVFLTRYYYQLKIKSEQFDEQLTYCHGWLDGVYYATQETSKNLLYEELAVRAYREYKGIKDGPTKH